MIIECKNCQKKFVVSDSAIPDNGRTVQCSNCSTEWLQMPISSTVRTDQSEVDDNLQANKLEKQEDESISSNEEVKASDGKMYKFMGKQWAQLLRSGKTGKLARKKIAFELNRKTGRMEEKHHEEKNKITPSKETSQIYSEKDKGGMGIFSFLIVLIISFAALILFLDTFKNQIIPFWPELDSYLVYIYETISNIFIIIKDLFNNYK